MILAAAKTAAAAVAKTGADGASTSSWLQTFSVPSQWPRQMDLLEWSQKMGPGMATLLIILGIIYLLFGLYMFRALVVFNAACVGAWLGAAIGTPSGSAVPASVLGSFVAAAVAFPLMKFAVAAHGGMLGAMLGASFWRLLDGDPRFTWAGAAMGLIACGLFCFILFRGSVMAYMSLQGSLMLVFGILGLLYKYQDLGPKITESLQARHFILPMAIFIPAVMGMLFQQANKSSPAEPTPAKK
jgi:hypothetical protein